MKLYVGDKWYNAANVMIRKLSMEIPAVSWSPWTEFSACSLTCSGHTSGSKSRTRTCLNIPDNGDEATGCAGKTTDAVFSRTRGNFLQENWRAFDLKKMLRQPGKFVVY